VLTLRSTPDNRTDNLGFRLARRGDRDGYNLLPSISPTFQWIRLAQRIPVRVHLLEVPEKVELQVGTTASVLVRKGTGSREASGPLPPVPRALQ
jgi:multidrug resistance efflux pump